ncbi:MAG TPA: hypothetical protein VI479_14525 [Blastocatellia bacterium]
MRNVLRVFTIFIASLAGGALVNAQSSRSPVPGSRGSGERPPDATGVRTPPLTVAPGTRPGSSRRNPPDRRAEHEAGAASESRPNSIEPGLRFISSEMNFSGKVVKRAPYSAETLTETTQILNNGARLTRQTTGMVYRDDEGRTRREMSASTAGPFATMSDIQRLIFINDPVAGVSSTIIPGSDRSDSDRVITKPLPAASSDEPPETEMSSENSRTESLGKDVIEGLLADGTRTTILIPPGSIGNDEALEIVHERWYSPELQTILLSKHRDPRWGETVYRLRNIDRSAPDHSLFSLPAPSTPKGNKTRPRQ